jgi:hypothetical protein
MRCLESLVYVTHYIRIATQPFALRLERANGESVGA